ncbi:MAG TPA: type I-U CRISPR-associated helicase/endonuclease Cas3 [Candidatus Paceibacterota bacterium]|nr:type I-U CRISPR-associated helicase/endonuclease Cas3 [Candidatus Paceibacterota bacterium]
MSPVCETTSFEDAFALLTGGNYPFPWQRALYQRFVAGDFPKACDLPTGLGKTSVIQLWLLALARNPKLPRRLVYVVNRRTVVDQATNEAEKIRNVLINPGSLRDALAKLCAVEPRTGEAPLAVSTLRGERADNAEWRRDPARPAIVIGTVDMIGSRLLFSGYGCGFRSKPLHAGFLGQDALLVHDEAHLEQPFQQLLVAIQEEQRKCRDVRPLRVVALSATGREQPDFTLTPEDETHEIVRRRLDAKKGLRLHFIDDKKELPDRVAAKAAELQGKVIVFLSSVDHVEKCATALRKVKKKAVTLTGTMRGRERDDLVRNPIFARFLPKTPKDVELQDGTVYLVATSAGEVGIDISADHMVSDLPPFDALAQRLGRVNRYGEGDAQVHVYCEKLTESTKAKAETGDDEGDEDKSSSSKNDYERARFATQELLSKLQARFDDQCDASPAALRALSLEDRQAASTPTPSIRHVDALLFDRWSYTTITDQLPGRPPVIEWLHGVAEWEPPRTTVAWRREVSWLTGDLLGTDSLDEFLADYPLRAREMLNDVTSRVVKHLKKIAARDKDGTLKAWLIRNDAPAEFVLLTALLDEYDAKKNPLLDDATIVLPPEAGGLKGGLLDGDVEFVEGEELLYDLGPHEGERLVHQSEDESHLPAGMRLVRSVRREAEDDDVHWWHLYAASQRADDEGSRTSCRRLLLDQHLQRTEFWALRIAERLGLPEWQVRALGNAGRWHDLGKKRRVWQRSIKNFADPPLAKGVMQPFELSYYRHELGSLYDVLAEPDFNGLNTEERELALHVIAAHHGRARPHFPPREAYDPEVKQEVIAPLVSEVPLRFDRLQHEYGRWGLAWLESLLRAADVIASDDEDQAA